MAKTNRKTLKEYFGKGKKPDSSQFADLVDSMLNIVDDGFSKSPERGMLLSPLNNDGSVIEIRRHILDGDPAWIISLGKDEQLHIHRGLEEKAILSMHQDGRIVLGENSEIKLEVNGSISAKSYTGTHICNTAPANGEWHEVEEKGYGCQAYQVIAACGLKTKGKYAVTYATAMHCFGRNRKIYTRSSWFGSQFNRIQFRWKMKGDLCGLEVRSRRDYGEGVRIHYQVTSLLNMDFVTGNKTENDEAAAHNNTSER